MGNFWVDQGISGGLGLMVGLVTPAAGRLASRSYHIIRSRLELHAPSFRPEDIDFFVLNQWSPTRQLDPRRVQVTFDDAPWIQDWCEPTELARVRSEVKDWGGPASTLRSMAIDHRESQRGMTLRLSFGPSLYGDLVAASGYFATHPEKLREVMERLAREDTKQMIALAPPSVVAINMTVTSADGKLLAIRRSAAVTTSQNVWTLGPNETMSGATGASGGIETPHNLADRCLCEEIGIESSAIEKTYISWLGYNVPAALTHIVGHSRTKLRSAEIEDALQQSQGAFEVDAVDWLPATARSAHLIVNDVRQFRQSGKSGGRRWLDSAALAAADWWRWRHVLAG